MKKTAATLCILLLLTQALLLPVSAFCARFSANAASDLAALAAETETAYDGYLVALADGAQESELAPDGDWETVLPGVIHTDDLGLARSLLASGTAEYVETNDVVTLSDTETLPVQDGWVYEAVNVAYVEELELSGAGVRIAVIDSGVDMTNEDLRCADIEEGYDYLTDSAETMRDTVGHGTQVVQMIAADRNDKGGTGIARGATVVPLRCFSEKNGNLADIVRAVWDAVDVYDCDVINMSWGFKGNSQTLYDAVRHAYECGCILVAAAGNVQSSDPQGTVMYPAAYDEVIGVGAVTRTMTVSDSSQQTTAVSVSAPGEAVPVWYDGEEQAVSGTSFACPCAAAMLALARERLPSLDGAGAKQLVCERTVDRGAAGYDTAYGYGTLDVRTMLEKSWGYCRQEGDDTVLSGWLNCPEDCRTVAALYEQSGRMAACAFLPQPEGSGGFSYAFPGVTGALRCKLFCLDAGYRPAG